MLVHLWHSLYMYYQLLPFTHFNLYSFPAPKFSRKARGENKQVSDFWVWLCGGERMENGKCFASNGNIWHMRAYDMCTWHMLYYAVRMRWMHSRDAGMAESRLKVGGKRMGSAWKLDRKARQGRAYDPDIYALPNISSKGGDSPEFAGPMA